jgi:hypothetical protein
VEKVIDFQQILDDQKAMTEVQVPFTNFQIADAIFVDQHHILALEYAIFYPDAPEENDITQENIYNTTNN